MQIYWKSTTTALTTQHKHATFSYTHNLHLGCSIDKMPIRNLPATSVPNCKWFCYQVDWLRKSLCQRDLYEIFATKTLYSQSDFAISLPPKPINAQNGSPCRAVQKSWKVWCSIPNVQLIFLLPGQQSHCRLTVAHLFSINKIKSSLTNDFYQTFSLWWTNRLFGLALIFGEKGMLYSRNSK